MKKALDKIKANSIKDDSGCWIWQKSKNRGYGTTSFEGKVYSAHRLAYLSYYGSIDKDLVIDHICRNPSCVNPEHLELVTQKENIARAKKRLGPRPEMVKKFCKNGHEFTSENTRMKIDGKYKSQACKTCQRKWKKENLERSKYA